MVESRESRVEGDAGASKCGSVLLVISAPSGGGKTTVCNNLLDRESGLTRAITCTTRSPREGERDGVDYHFLNQDAFEQKLKAGAFLEHATVFGRSYGTLKSEVLDRMRNGSDVLLNIDVQGVANVRQAAPSEPELDRALVTVFLAPASMEVLEERLRGRASDSESEIKKRLRVARHELEHAPHFDYLIISGTMEEDVQRLHSILLAERLRQSRVTLPQY